MSNENGNISITDVVDLSADPYTGAIQVGDGTDDGGIRRFGPSEKGYTTFSIPVRFPVGVPFMEQQQANAKFIFNVDHLSADTNKADIPDWERGNIHRFLTMIRRAGASDLFGAVGKTVEGAVLKPSKEDETKLELSYFQGDRKK